MKLFQVDNFFPDLDCILPEIKKIKLYSLEEFNSQEKATGVWIGYRSAPLIKCSPILHMYILNLISEKNLLEKGSWKIDSYLHLRLEDDDQKEWIHKDPNDFTTLIYISNTNLKSGTYLYDEDKNIITDIKFVKNRLIMFERNYNHRAYGNHGNSIENGRLTINLFMSKLK